MAIKPSRSEFENSYRYKTYLTTDHHLGEEKYLCSMVMYEAVMLYVGDTTGLTCTEAAYGRWLFHDGLWEDDLT